MNTEETVKFIGGIKRSENRTFIVIQKEYAEALKGLEEFSHCHVLWWSGYDYGLGFNIRSILSGELPYAPGRESGVFACRGPFRPNPIAITVCPIVAVNSAESYIEILNIDALDDTEVLDIKPYYPSVDRVKNPRIPSWLPNWGDWIPENGFKVEE